MRSKILFRIPAAGLMALTLCAAIDDPNAVKAAIQKEMNGYVAATKKKDGATVVKFILANFSPDFKDTDMKGNVRTRQQTIDAMKGNMASLKSVEVMKLDITSIKVTGNKATTTEHMVMAATLNPFQEGSKPAKLNVDSTWVGSYVKKGAKWWCTSSKTVKEKVLLDGKPIG
jgi:hypothetical protein